MMTIPKYVQALIAQKRIGVASIDEQSAPGGVYGYIFRIYRLSNSQYDHTLEQEATRLIAWANRCVADAKMLDFFNERTRHKSLIHCFTEKEHRKPFYKRDYILLSITDPVAQKLEQLIKSDKP